MPEASNMLVGDWEMAEKEVSKVGAEEMEERQQEGEAEEVDVKLQHCRHHRRRS
jgi:hypothetical protein